MFRRDRDWTSRQFYLPVNGSISVPPMGSLIRLRKLAPALFLWGFLAVQEMICVLGFILHDILVSAHSFAVRREHSN
jgi:hypothetical protein